MKINHILFAILFTGLSLSIQAQKFGYLNSQVLLAELPEVKAADAEIQALQTQLEKKGQMMVQELENKYKELQEVSINFDLENYKSKKQNWESSNSKCKKMSLKKDNQNFNQ